MIRSSKQTAIRYEPELPGELAHMDVKKLGRIPDGGGWNTRSRSMGSTAARKRTSIGYGYVHSQVDDCTRLAYSEILPMRKAPPARRSLPDGSTTSPPAASPTCNG